MKTKELVVISGKGGTGKTSIAASLALLARNAVVVDCDVDASNMHLILQPSIRERHVFRSGRLASIRPDDCVACGLCLSYCRFDAVRMPHTSDPAARFGAYAIDPVTCEGCGLCARICPQAAIDLTERECGEWMVSDTRAGTMVHADLGTGAENSGKLVSVVRENAGRIARETGAEMIIVDGPPGIGCPVIASLTGATHALVITEPTVSGEHDLERIMELTAHFRIPTSVCVNKWDINAELTERMECAARNRGTQVAGGIRFDPSFTKAQISGLAVVETDSPAADDIRSLWAWLERMP